MDASYSDFVFIGGFPIYLLGGIDALDNWECYERKWTYKAAGIIDVGVWLWATCVGRAAERRR